MKFSFDYLVVGAGPGGYSSAIRAAQLGLKTAIVEKEHPGGICLNWGCIPTKALLASAHLYEKIKQHHEAIVFKDQPTPNLSAMVDHSRQVATRLQAGIRSLFKKYGVTLLEGHAQLVSENEIQVTDSQKQTTHYTAQNTCIATGAAPKALPNLPFSQKVLSYRQMLVHKEIPESLLVIGGGAIGLEFADLFACLGSRVMLVEMAEHILPQDDAPVAQYLRKALEKKGIRFFEGAKISSISEKKSGIECTLQINNEKSETIAANLCLVSIGVIPNSTGNGLESMKISDERGFIRVDDKNLVLGKKHLYAIGDITAGKLLAHRAAHQGISVAEIISGKKHHPCAPIPGCIYTSPQVATIGFSEAELKTKGIQYQTGEFPWLASGMAIAARESNGFSRVFTAEKTGEILGAQIGGENASELIGVISLAMSSELLGVDFQSAIFPHPSLSETVAESFALIDKACVNL